MGEKRNACRVSIAEAEEEWPLGRHRRRWEIILKYI
jgi:hypothetical protein